MNNKINKKMNNKYVNVNSENQNYKKKCDPRSIMIYFFCTLLLCGIGTMIFGIVASSNVHSNYVNLNASECLVNSTDIKNSNDHDYKYSLYVTYFTVQNNESYYCDDYKTSSDNYDHILSIETKYPAGTEFDECSFNYRSNNLNCYKKEDKKSKYVKYIPIGLVFSVCMVFVLIILMNYTR